MENDQFFLRGAENTWNLLHQEPAQAVKPIYHSHQLIGTRFLGSSVRRSTNTKGGLHLYLSPLVSCINAHLCWRRKLPVLWWHPTCPWLWLAWAAVVISDWFLQVLKHCPCWTGFVFRWWICWMKFLLSQLETGPDCVALVQVNDPVWRTSMWAGGAHQRESLLDPTWSRRRVWDM